MTIGKKRMVHVLVNIDTITNLDDFTLEQRFETFIDPHRFREERLDDKEYMRFITTAFKFYPFEGERPVKTAAPLPLVEPPSPEMKLQRIKALVEGIKGKYSHPDDLERVVFEAFGQIAALVK